MFGQKGLELIKELNRTPDVLPPFNDDVIRQVLEEMNALFEQNRMDLDKEKDANYAGVHVRHASLERNRRCLLAYLYNRINKIRQMRWEFGSIIPPEIKYNMCEPEVQWFNNYNKILATYMRGIGNKHGLNLTLDRQPPKELYIEVRCLEDYGEYEMDNGDVVTLRKGNMYLLPRGPCEQLIRQGILQHITD
ncbi:hypothetical protein R5R35_001770 [Gryllus longicercus]|uniref:DNA replication complex GINS protein PSF1 n=1 Tax=Gryllus longicercus TaxID=2509291 RepID=A0AAN9W1V2_9ORTH|nr:DNA replication complex GINS protein PSF1 [Gryllus bimaculatus]